MGLAATSVAIPVQAEDGFDHGSSAPKAVESVERIVARTMEVLKASDMDVDARRESLKTLLDEALDLPVIASFALGHHASKLSSEERAQFEELFATYVVTGYARAISREDIERIEVIRSRRVTPNNAAVSTRVTRSDGGEGDWIWRLHRRDDVYRVVDLQTADVSMAITYRAQIGTSMAEEGLEGVLGRLKEHLAKDTAMRGDQLALSHLLRGTPFKSDNHTSKN